jgi:hypothetical protein
VSNGGGRSEPPGGVEPTVDECVEAGLYYFAREDLVEARRWWERALVLEPSNARVRECLRILERAGSRDVARSTGELDTPDLAPFGPGDGSDDVDPFADPGPVSIDPLGGVEGPSGAKPAPPVELNDSPLDRWSRPAAPAAEPSPLEQWSRPSLPPGAALPSLPALAPGWDPGEQLRIDGGIATIPPPPSGPLEPIQPSQLLDDRAFAEALAEARSPPAEGGSGPLRIEPDQILFDGWGDADPPDAIRFDPLGAVGDDVLELNQPVDDGPSPEELIGETPPGARPGLRDPYFERPVIRRSAPPEFEVAIEDPVEDALPVPPEDVGLSIEAYALSAFGGEEDEAELIPIEAPTEGPAIPFEADDDDRDPIPIEAPTEGPTTTPWDFGPAETTAVTLEQNEERAVAEMTPLPTLDRAPLFEMAGARPGSDPPPLAPSPPPLVEPEVERPEDPSLLLAKASDRMALHDFDGALSLLEQIPPAAAEHAPALGMMDDARRRLEQIYSAKIGPVDASPKVLLSGEELIWLNLNHRAGFILSQVDGRVSYDDLIALSGMPRLDTLRILCTLLQEGVIGVD